MRIAAGIFACISLCAAGQTEAAEPALLGKIADAVSTHQSKRSIGHGRIMLRLQQSPINEPEVIIYVGTRPDSSRYVAIQSTHEVELDGARRTCEGLITDRLTEDTNLPSRWYCDIPTPIMQEYFSENRRHIFNVFVERAMTRLQLK